MKYRNIVIFIIGWTLICVFLSKYIYVFYYHFKPKEIESEVKIACHLYEGYDEKPVHFFINRMLLRKYLELTVLIRSYLDGKGSWIEGEIVQRDSYSGNVEEHPT